MARCIPQHLFDGLVVYRMMATLAGNEAIFNELVQKYRDVYPDEPFDALIADVDAAAGEGRHIVEIVVLRRPAGDRDEMAVLQAFLAVFKEDAARDKPLWRRMVENYFLNVQPTPIPDRVERAREHLEAAQKTLLARGPRSSATP